MRIIIDAMGGDNAPHEVIKGSIQAVHDFGIDIILVGKRDIIQKELENYTYPPEKVFIEHADEVITNDDIPTKAIKSKHNASLVVGLKMLNDKKADAFVSAGNTGALLTCALLRVGRIKGIDRPALTPVIPTDTGCALLVDAGANIVCKPVNFQQFGIMGSTYMKKVIGIHSPRVALVNIGAEEGKGTDLIKSTHPLMKNIPINFIGNIEAREIPSGGADVIVCDGFVGNVILKLMEGMGLTFYKNIKSIFTKNILGYFSAFMIKSGLKEFKKKMDYTEYGGAPLLGINGAVIKAHGSSNAKAFYYAILQAKKFVENGVIDEIRQHIGGKEAVHSDSDE